MGRHSVAQSSAKPVVALVVPALAVAGVAAGVYASNHGTQKDGARTAAVAGSEGSCSDPQTVRVTAPVEIAPVLRQVTEKYAKSGGPCAKFEVTEQDAQTTARAVATDAADSPQIWVTDSPMWVQRVNQTLKQRPLKAGGTVATSPIGMAVPGALAAGGVPTGKQSFPKLFAASGGKLPMNVADLDTSSATLLGTTVAMGQTGADQKASLGLARTMVGLSHKWSTDAELQLQAGTAGDKAVMFPASEQQMFTVNQLYPKAPVKAMSFVEGDPTLDYRVVPVTGPKAASTEQVQAVEDALTSAEGVEALKKAGFRVGGSTGPGIEGISGESKAAPVTLDQVDTAVRVTDAVGLDINLLTVMDVTGSMKDPAIGTMNRAQVATAAVQKAVSLFPSQTRFGLWEFAAGINGKGKPNYRELVPNAPLSKKVGRITQEKALLGALAAMPNHLAGGTPLYDTILAAYKSSQAKAVPNQTSAMVLVTDGKDEDFAGLSLQELLRQLDRAKDPKRPVKVILVGIGQQADMPTLRTIARATGGAAYNASDPADIPNVVFDALAQRVTVATEL